MSTGWKFTKVAGGLILCAANLYPGRLSFAQSASSQIQPTHNQQTHHQQTHKKAKKTPAPPPDLPNGPTGPVPAIPLESSAPVAPQVSYENAQLTIVAPNSTLADILRAVRKQTGAEIDIPTAPERVVTHLGPGPAREVVAELLNGSRFNYVLLGSPANDEGLTRVLLVPRTSTDTATPTNAPAPGQIAYKSEPDPGTDANASEETDPAADAAAAEAEQPAPPPAAEQPGAKSPQEMLQEMQQRQLQLQQQQTPGQPPVPGSGIPPRMPPEQPPQQ